MRVTINANVVGLTPTREMKYLIFSFPHFGNKAEGGEFRHSTHNVSRIRRKMTKERVLMGTECLNTGLSGSLCLRCHVQDARVKLQ